MCKGSTVEQQQQQEKTSSSATTTTTTSNSSNSLSDFTSAVSSLVGKVWPLHPAVALAILSTFPSWCYLNRGFTQWFHWATVVYMVTSWKFLPKFQVLAGISICLGWYSALAWDFIAYGRPCVALYKNMPSVMRSVIIVEDTATGTTVPDYESSDAILMMIAAHILDILGHPILTYYFWKKHQQQEREEHNNNNTSHASSSSSSSFQSVCTWPAIIFSYLFSRVWSFTQVYHNSGGEKLGLFYVGFDVYVMDSLDCWYAAYAAETVFYVAIVIWKLCFMTTTTTTTTTRVSKQLLTDVNEVDDSSSLNNNNNNNNNNNKKPGIILSASSVSEVSQ